MDHKRSGPGDPCRRGKWLRTLRTSGLLVCLAGSSPALAADNATLAKSLQAVCAVGLNGEGHEAAMLAAKELATLQSDATTAVLEAMKDASPLAKNWLRTIAADLADNGQFPRENLVAFFSDRSQDADARHAAYRLLIAADPSLQPELLQSSLDDPSLPIRHAAIADTLKAADAAKAAEQPQQAIALYRQVIEFGRNPDQLQAATKALEGLGLAVNLATELGLVRRWWAIGTYDNTGSEHFNTVYEPEAIYLKQGKLPTEWLEAGKVVSGAVPGKKEVKCQLVTSDDSFGVVNINPAFENAKDVVAYCYVELELDRAVQGEARLGSITASKVWVNGQEVSANEVYHSGSRIDQYNGRCDLKAGTNTVLIKVLQNAQTEPWAQDWQFQFRLTDLSGAAVKPTAQSQPSTNQDATK